MSKGKREIQKKQDGGQKPKIDVNSIISDKKKHAKRYNEITEIFNTHKDRFYYVEATGLVIDLLATEPRVKDRLKPAPEEDKVEVLRLHKEKYMPLKLEWMREKRNTYGINKATGSILEGRKAELLEWFGQLHSVEEIRKKLDASGLVINVKRI